MNDAAKDAVRYTVTVAANAAIGTFTATLRAKGRKDRTSSSADRAKAIAGVLCFLRADIAALVKVEDEQPARGVVWTPEQISARHAGFIVCPKAR